MEIRNDTRVPNKPHTTTIKFFGCRNEERGNNSGREDKENYDPRPDVIHSRVVFSSESEHKLESMGSSVFSYDDVDTHIDVSK